MDAHNPKRFSPFHLTLNAGFPAFVKLTPLLLDAFGDPNSLKDFKLNCLINAVCEEFSCIGVSCKVLYPV